MPTDRSTAQSRTDCAPLSVRDALQIRIERPRTTETEGWAATSRERLGAFVATPINPGESATLRSPGSRR